MTAVQINPVVRLEIASQPELLEGARALIAAMAQRCGFNEILCGQISLAVDEALCNIIKHGYNCREDERIWISISIARGCLARSGTYRHLMNFKKSTAKLRWV